MKKLMIFLLLGMFMISFASAAFGFDNGIKYRDKDMNVDFENGYFFGIGEWLGFNEQIGTAELKSHKSVNEILPVASGKDVVTMFYEFNFEELYQDGLGEVEFINMTDGEVIEKDYHFVIWGTIYEEKNNYTRNCVNVTDESNQSVSKNCISEITGTYIEESEGWIRLNNSDIPKGIAKIGIATDVNIGDHIDGIWTIVGKEITRHAEWTESLNANLEAFYRFDDNLATTNVIDATTGHDATSSTNTNNLYSADAIINSSFNFVRTNSEGILTDIDTTDYSAWTISLWMKYDGGDNYNIIAQDVDGQRAFYFSYIQSVGSGTRFRYFDSFTETNAPDIASGVWTHVVIVNAGNGTGGTIIYQNGTFVSAGSGQIPGAKTSTITIGYKVKDATYFNGNMDEVGIWSRVLTSDEVTQLYNDGNGITYTDEFDVAPNVILISPANDSNFTSGSIDFIANATDDEQIVNVSLYLDGVLNETNSSGVNGTYTFSKVVNEGVHNWSILAYDNASLSNQSETRTFNFTLPLESINVNLNKPDDDIFQENTTVEFNWTITPTNVNTTNWTLNVWFSNDTLAHQHINTTINTNESVDVIHDDTLFFDETYIWNVESCGVNSGAVCDLSENRTFTIDTIPPVINITYPLENFIVTTPQQNITLNYTVEHNGSLSNCFYNTTFNSTEINISCTTNTTSLLYPNTDPDNLTIHVFGNDSAGNIGSDSVTIFKDATAPEIQFVSPTTENGSFLQDYIVANVTAVDDGLNTTTIFLYNSSGSLVNSTSGSTSPLFINFTNLAEGTYFLNATANDSFGNTNSTETRTIILLEIISWGGFVGDEYQLILFADSINEGGLEINDVTIEELSSGVWKINTTETDDELSRAKIMATLFDGTDGTDPRATSTFITNPTKVLSSDPGDDGMRGFLYRTTSNRDGYTVAGNITSVDNNNVTMWFYSRCSTGGNDCGPITLRMPASTIIKNFPFVTSSRTTNYIGTINSDSVLNPVNFSMAGGDVSVGTSTEERILILSKGNISFIFNIGVSSGSSTNSSTDFYNDEGFPELTYPQGIISLNSPTNGEFLSSQQVQFNCSAEIDDGTNMSNMTLYTNDTGSWEARNSTTGLSGNSSTQTWTRTLSDANGYIWNCQACDSNGVCGFYIFNKTFSVDSQLPSIDVESPSGVLDYNFIGGDETLNVTFSDTNLDTCWYNYNGTNITIDGCLTEVKNSTTFILEEDNFNMTIYANDSLGNENSTFINWSYKVLELNRTFESSVFETDSQAFSINLSANSSLTSVNLIYDGTSRSTTLSNNISTVTFDIPTSTGVKDFFWSFTYVGETINSTESNQTVNEILFDFCNATLTVSYINFSFKNETVNQEDVTATIDSSWNVWIGNGNSVRSFTLTNSSENTNYDICVSADNQTINTNVTLVYNNANSQQRAFVSEPILANSTTQQVLYLLPSTLGLFSQFQARDIANNPIPLVKSIITRTLNSGTINVVSFFTDSSGLVVYFLNPDVIYTATFSKTGFLDTVFTFVPTTDLRFVTMGTGVTVNGSNISIGTLYEITPESSTLVNNTVTTFTFNVTGSTEIIFISMNITDGNGTSFGFNSSAGTGIISLILNTSSNSTLTGIFQIRTGGENLTISKIWTIGNEFQGDYSIQKQGELFLLYEFSDFIRLAMVLLMIFGVVIFMSSNELADNNESKIAVVVLMVWGFSSIGWLNNPAVVSTTGIAQFSKQYGIAILSTAGAVFFFIRRIFI